MRVDAEMDFHGFSRAGMLAWLEQTWGSRRWHGLRRIRIIHGRGEVLHAALREWCDGKGIFWSPESGNPGATIIRPASRESHVPTVVHMPLKHIKKQVTASPPRKPPESPDPEDSEMFERAVSDLDDTSRRTMYRKKHEEA